MYITTCDAIVLLSDQLYQFSALLPAGDRHTAFKARILRV